MPPLGSFGSSSPSSGAKLVALTLGLLLAFYTVGPPLYWRVARSSVAVRYRGSCAPCFCDCFAESDAALLPGSGNTQSSGCGKLDPVVREDADKGSLELLSEELKLQERVAEESQRHADSALLDSKKLASQFQKEAEKCNAGMETCEEARERSDLALAAQRQASAVWEKRARELGWRDRPDRQSIFSRIGFSSVAHD